MAAGDIRNWFARVLRSKLSTCVIVLFAAALILPWGAYASLTISERSEQIERTKHSLAALATAYGEHATTLMRLGIVIPTDEPISKSPVPDSEAQGEKEIVAFRESLNAPGVRFSLRRIGKPNTPLNSASGPDATLDRAPTFYVGKETISAEVDRRAAGIAATASMRASEALKSWQERSNIEAMALLLRSFFVIGVGLFLVQQLRRREAAEAELVSAKENAESGSRAKSEFLANMSHELRTPLNAIIGFAEIMKNRTFGSLSERYLDYVGDIYNSGTHLLALINDILNLSKLEAGQLELQEKEVDIRDAIADCIRLVETQARQSNIRLSVSLDRNITLLRADERRLRQILINLLSNAVKFTPKGGHVGISSIRRNNGLAIIVRDTGIGMAPEDIPLAMTAFGQVDSKVRRREEGTGLGLPLAKHLVELHGGTFAIESRLNVGTTVTFVLPAERIIAAPARLAPAMAAS